MTLTALRLTDLKMATAIRALALVLTVTSSVTAHAAEVAPATVNPTRLVTPIFSVQWPGGEDWILTGSSSVSKTFLQIGTHKAESFVADIKVEKLDQIAASVEDLARQLKSGLSKAGSERFTVLTFEVSPVPTFGSTCVFYHQVLEDHSAPKKWFGDSRLLLDGYGSACLHPDDTSLLVSATLSRRAPPDDIDAGLKTAAVKFIDGVKLYSPLVGEALRPLAEAGNTDAQIWLAGWILGEREANPGGVAEAISWLRKAAGAGNHEAMTRLGYTLVEGKTVEANPAEGLKLLTQAAEAGYPRAAGMLGTALALKTSEDATPVTPHSQAIGVGWLKKGAAAGDLWSRVLLAEVTYFGKLAGVEANEADGAAWWRKAAQQGDADAQYRYGLVNLLGRGVPKNVDAARFWLTISAEQGHAGAANTLKDLNQ